MGKLGKLPDLPGFKPAQHKRLVGLSDVKGEKVNTKPNEGVYVVDCTNSDFTVETKCAKMGIESCKHTTVNINYSPMSSMLEITNCEHLDVYMAKDVMINTITVDGSSHVTLHVVDPPNQMHKVFWHKVSKVIVDRGEAGEFLLDKCPNNNQEEIYQFICQVQADGSFSVDPAIRVETYPATENELSVAAERGAHTKADQPKTVTVDLSNKIQ